MRPREGAPLNCAHCGTEFYVAPSIAAKGRKFCSLACRDAANAAKTINVDKGLKRCSSCGEWKPFEQFYKNSSGGASHGLQGNCIPCCKVANAKFKAENKAHLRAYKRARYHADPEKHRAIRRNLTDEQRQKKNAAAREYRAKNKEKVAMWNRLRRHRERAAGEMPHRFEIGRMLCMQDARCVYCNALLSGQYHIDHKTPVSRGGTNANDNLQILCPTCNMKKGASTHEEYLRRISEERETKEAA